MNCDLTTLRIVTPSEEIAKAAWKSVSKAVHQPGSYWSVDFGPITNATIRHLGGWPKSCALRRRTFEGSFRRKFMATHARFRARGGSEKQGGPLWGLHDLANYRDGFREHIRRPVRIPVVGEPYPPPARPGPRQSDP